LAVLVVLADVDHWQLPQLRHVHDLVQQALAERTFAEEADRDLVAAAHLGREPGPGRDASAAADDGVGAEVAVLLVGDVHRTALAAAVPGRTTEKLGEHEIEPRALGDAMPVPSVRGGDVVTLHQCLTYA